ncbi:MAG: MerR family transcriptional regulator [Kineosporiaceae bacterium]
MLTIKQLAEFVGVTVRAVRHYHARGLLPEPERDSSGYRRYGAQAVADLVRIKTLAEAGVPLSRVQTLLRATPEEFARAVEEIDRSLQAEIDRLQRSRERVARLGAGEHLVLPDEVVDYLDHLRSLGVSERGVAMEREGWTVIAGRAPDRAVEWTALKQEQLEDPQFRQLYLAFDRAFDLDPDDPALIDLAEDVCVFLSRMEAELGGSDEAEISEHLAPLLDAWIIPASPAWRRLKTLIEQRGWRGWTQIERAAPQDR